jgi:hypothetical protein
MSKERLFTLQIRAMGSWLRENGLNGINNQERYRALSKQPEIGLKPAV